ncbi:MAG: class C beta-lactamase-related serine hydrolase [Chloroflexi bacterium]|nr:MAG: class C beta-lactamase-related serine hydrolase [Chloroflexota bacterium]
MRDVIEFPSPADQWAAIEFESEGWKKNRLDEVLELAGRVGTSALLILHRGRIAAEGYWNDVAAGLDTEGRERFARFNLAPDRSGRPVEDVGAVQNCMTATLLAIARDRGIIDFNHPVQEHLGPGWSSASLDQEREIAIWHLMSMTSGLDDQLRFVAPAGVEWLYNPSAYQQLIRVLTRSSGLDPDAMLRDWLGDRIGMASTRWVARDWSGSGTFIGLASTARDLGRFALLIQNRGRWENEVVVSADALDELLNPSQTMNPAYGLLWWLNGREAFVMPASQARVTGPLLPAAPQDAVLGFDTLNRQLAISWEQELSLVRLGAGIAEPAEAFDTIWTHLLAALPD